MVCIVSLLLLYIVSSTVIMEWWRESRNGTNVAQAHRIWHVNGSLLLRPDLSVETLGSSRLIRGKFEGYMLAIAALLRRAAQDQTTQIIGHNTTLALDIVERIPNGWIPFHVKDETLGNGPCDGIPAAATSDLVIAARTHT